MSADIDQSVTRTDKWLRAYTTWAISRRIWILAAILAVTAVLGLQTSKLKMDMDPDIWAPQDHPYIQATRLIERVFGGRNFTVIGIVPKSGDIYQVDILAKIERIQKGVEEITGSVRHNVVSLAADKAKQIKAVDDGMDVRRFLEVPPLTPEEFEQLKSALAENPIYRGVIVSPDGKGAAVIADFRLPKDDPTYSALYNNLKAVVDKERDETIDVYLGGLPVVVAWFEFHMMKMPIYFGIAVLIIMLVQYWSFRSFQGMLLPTATGILSVIWALGLMAVFDVHMDGMNTTTPILIMTVAAGHAVQILKRYYEEYQRLHAERRQSTDSELNDAAIVESLAKVGGVMVVIGAIAVAAFYSLLLADISVVRHFGMFAGTGILTAVVLEMTMVPALRSLLPTRKSEVPPHESVVDRMLVNLADWLTDGRARVVFGVCLLLVAAALFGIFRLQVDSSFKRYNAADSEVRHHDEMLNKYFAGTNSIFFLVESPEPDGMKNPGVLRGMAALQEFLSTQPQVGKTQSISDLIRRMHMAMNGDDPQYDVIPDSPRLVAQYLFLYSLSGSPQDFDNFVDNDYQRGLIWVYMKDDSTAEAEELYKKAQAVIRDSFPPNVVVRMGGSLPQTIAINQVVTKEKLKNMLQISAVMFLLSSLLFRSFVGGLFVVIPLFLVMVVNAGLLGWLGIPLDMSAATTVAMAIGIGADYEIYLISRFREELRRTGDITIATRTSLLTSGKAVLFVAISLVGGYAVLLVSDFSFYTRLGVTVMVTMVVTAASALIFLRSLITIFKPNFIFRDSAYQKSGQFAPLKGDL